MYVDIHGGLLERGRQMRVGWSYMAIFASFARYIFRTFTFKATIIILYYVAPYSVSSLTPKRMTLNDHELLFCVKIYFELGIQWSDVLAFGENCSEICRATHILSAAKNVAQLLYWWYKSYGVIQWNKRTGSVKPVNYISVFTLTVLTHVVHWCL